MEEDLDEISKGERPWLDFVRAFYRGDGKHRGLAPAVVEGEQNIDYPVIDFGTDPESGQPIRVRIGRYGPFLQIGEGGPGNTASIPDDIPPADLTVDRAMSLVRARAAGPRVLGQDPATGQTVYALNGRFGAYVQLGETPEKGTKGEKPRRASLPRSVAEDQVTLGEALRLLDLPRTLGRHPDTGEAVIANAGRFGPYVKHGDEFRSLEADDDVHTVALERALVLLAAPKKARRRQAAAVRTVLRELGAHPDTGKPVQILDGRYGPYVTDGTVNASLPKGTDPASLALADALGLLAARAAAGPARKRAAGKLGHATGARKRVGPAK
jgi:DNA topoisomerase-1